MDERTTPGTSVPTHVIEVGSSYRLPVVPRAAPPAALVLDPATDNVAVALRALDSGERIEVADRELDLVAQIPAGHKLALAPIAAGQKLLKYGEPIGIAVVAIGRGDHVHVHNVASARLPGSDP